VIDSPERKRPVQCSKTRWFWNFEHRPDLGIAIPGVFLWLASRICRSNRILLRGVFLVCRLINSVITEPH
jgi:hypothetical protein